MMFSNLFFPRGRLVWAGLLCLGLAACSGSGTSGLGTAPAGVDTARWKVDASECMRQADRLAGREMDSAAGGSGTDSALMRDMARMDARKARDRYYRNCLASKGYATP